MVSSATSDLEEYADSISWARTWANNSAVSIPCECARRKPTRCEEGKLVEAARTEEAPKHMYNRIRGAMLALGGVHTRNTHGL